MRMGTDPNQRGAMGDTLLHLPAETGDIQTLVDAGANVNAEGDIGNTPLHGAALRGKTRAAEKLLQLGANDKAHNQFGETPLDVAKNGGHREIVALLKRRS
jgi:uncharacterized protein